MTFVHSDDQAMGDLGYERRTADFYPTPEWVTEAVIPRLLERRLPVVPVWEPACGLGDMSRVLERHFDRVHSSDLHAYGYGSKGVDFLASQNVHAKGMVVTNPPYGALAEAFIRKALQVTEKHHGVVAMLLRNEYDSAKERADLFRNYPFAEKLVLTSRPRWIADSTGAPRHNYAWFIWDWADKSSPRITYHIRADQKRRRAIAASKEVSITDNGIAA